MVYTKFGSPSPEPAAQSQQSNQQKQLNPAHPKKSSNGSIVNGNSSQPLANGKKRKSGQYISFHSDDSEPEDEVPENRPGPSKHSAFPASPTVSVSLPYQPNGTEYTNGTSNGHVNGKLKGKRKADGTADLRDEDWQKLKEERQRLLKTRKELPVWAGRDSIIKAIKENDTVVILGETGSGKTTQIPQFLFSDKGVFSEARIAVTQPRRVAATSLSTRVAAEVGTHVGDKVGHSVRFDTKVGSRTRITYLTEGMCVKGMMTDPMLTQYDIVIIDEAHERNVSTDILLGSLKRIQETRNRTRPPPILSNGTSNGTNGFYKESAGRKEEEEETEYVPLKVVIMSATLDAERFSEFFNKCPILYVRGRQHPVSTYHLRQPISATNDDYIDVALRVFFQIHTAYPLPGDVLIFMTGQEDIDSLNQRIIATAKNLPPSHAGVLSIPFMSSSTAPVQKKVFDSAPQNTRKVILSTNVAETSITIPGIKYVIDTGLAKVKKYLWTTNGSGIDSLKVERISRSAALQRTGRAGREGPGSCYRLYAEEEFKNMDLSPLPEIKRVNLAQVVLQLKNLNSEQPDDFDWLDRPDPNFLAESLMILFSLDALDKQMQITDIGRRILKYPLEPTQARTLIAAVDRGCVEEIIDILALINEVPILAEPSDPEKREEAGEAHLKFRHRDGDHLTLLNVLRAYESLPKNDKQGRRSWARDNFINERNLINAIKARDQLRDECLKEGVTLRSKSANGSAGDTAKEEAVLRSLLDGGFMKCAILQNGVYKQVLGNTLVKIHPSSSLHNKNLPGIIYSELVHTSNTYARCVSYVQHSWITEAPLYRLKAAEDLSS